jgi:hypothetical protein
MNSKGLFNNQVTPRRISTIITALSCLVILLSYGAPLHAARAAVQAAAPLNYLPEGEHLWAEGIAHAQDCAAVGWARDPDDPARLLDVHILSDGGWVTTVKADICSEGTCYFSTSLWGLITPVVYHQITAQAYDVETAQWYDLAGTPKTLSCTNYDLYTLNLKTGLVERITTQEDTGEYNPSWSPNSKFIVHDFVNSFTQDLYITNLDTGESTPLPGGEGGNDASWSPNGQWIVFDAWVDDVSTLFLVSPAGGTPQLIKSHAADADWAPNSQTLVYQVPSDGSLRTVSLNGKGDKLLVPHGVRPAWSPNGQWIAYELGGDIWKVRVNVKGVPLSDPVQLTSGPALDTNPTWLNNSKTIVFSSLNGNDYDLWKIPAKGGAPVWLAGLPGSGDYDPEVSNNGKFLAWAGPQVP